MCDELGDETMMRAYVEEEGETGLCQVKNPVKCNEKELAYIEKWGKTEGNAASVALERLIPMSAKPMTPDLKLWINQRMSILKQIGAGKSDETDAGNTDGKEEL